MRNLLLLLAITTLGCTELLPDRDAAVLTDAIVVVDAAPPTPAELRFVATATRHTCAATDDRIYCWGYAEQGQIGNGELPDPMNAIITTPTETSLVPRPIGGLFAGPDGTCAIVDMDRELHCWGKSTADRFGSSSSLIADPTPMPGGFDGIVDVGIGVRHTCFVTDEGNLHCVGSNLSGALGIGEEDGGHDRPQLIDVPGLALRVAVSTDQPTTTCAVVGPAPTEVYCWGSNDDLQAGADMGILEFWSPTLVDGLTGAQDVVLGESFGCALMDGGDVRCWGEADDGQLGADRADSPVPMNVSVGVQLEGLELGRGFAIGWTSTGDIYGWGNTTDGRLGVMEQMAPLAPGRLDEVPGAMSIVVSAHNQHSCYLARFADRAPSLRCSGDNDRGQLGIRDRMSLSAFTEIRVP